MPESEQPPAPLPFAQLVQQLPELAEIEGLEKAYTGLGPSGKNTVCEYVEIEVGKKAKPGYDAEKAEARMKKMVVMLERRDGEAMEQCVVL